MRSRDTSAAAHEAQLRVYRRMTPEQRSELAMKLSEDVRELARGGIRARHPEYGARDVELALLRILYGDELVRRAYPLEPLRAP